MAEEAERRDGTGLATERRLLGAEEAAAVQAREGTKAVDQRIEERSSESKRRMETGEAAREAQLDGWRMRNCRDRHHRGGSGSSHPSSPGARA
jgi:hypothetical protein